MAFGETSDGVGATEEEAFVDGNVRRARDGPEAAADGEVDVFAGFEVDGGFGGEAGEG